MSLFLSDLTGAQDGSVRMFEWGHSQQIICFRSPGNSRVTRIRFNHQGNKVIKSHTHSCWMHWAVEPSELPPCRCQTVLSFATWPHHVMWACQIPQHFHTSSHNCVVWLQRTRSSAEWFNRSEPGHSPQANNFLRWCLSCASAILSACSGQKSEICF